MPIFPYHPIFISVDLMIDQGPGTPFNVDGTRDYLYKYMVRVRVPIDQIQACFAPTIPPPFALHPKDLAALCTNKSAELQDKEDWGIWIVTVKFSTRMPEGGQSKSQDPSQDKGSQNNPEQEPPDIEWDNEVINRPAPKAKDLDNHAFLNYAGQPFTPAPTFEYAYPVLSISRNELDYNHKKAARYSFAVNKDRFLGYDPGTVQCMPPKAKLIFRGPISYYRVSYKLRFGIMGDDGKPEPWDPVEILNQGMMELKKLPLLADPVLVPIRINGHVVTQPILLDANGKKMLPKKPLFGVGPPVLNPVWIKFRIRPSYSFSDLIRDGLGGKL